MHLLYLVHYCWNQGTIISSFTRWGVIPAMAEAQSSCEKYLRKEPKALALEAEMGLGMPGDAWGGFDGFETLR